MLPELEKKKERLEQIRDFVGKPMDRDEYRSHQQKYEEIRRKKLEEIGTM